jgi:hypothetical protein
MSTLLLRKESLAAAEPEKSARPLAATTSPPLPMPTRPPTVATAAEPPPKPVTNADAPSTTTERLLALKRNRDKS